MKGKIKGLVQILALTDDNVDLRILTYIEVIYKPGLDLKPNNSLRCTKDL